MFDEVNLCIRTFSVRYYNISDFSLPAAAEFELTVNLCVVS